MKSAEFINEQLGMQRLKDRSQVRKLEKEHKKKVKYVVDQLWPEWQQLVAVARANSRELTPAMAVEWYRRQANDYPATTPESVSSQDMRTWLQKEISQHVWNKLGMEPRPVPHAMKQQRKEKPATVDGFTLVKKEPVQIRYNRVDYVLGDIGANAGEWVEKETGNLIKPDGQAALDQAAAKLGVI